jgi:PAS domain S-box-containing protein
MNLRGGARTAALVAVVAAAYLLSAELSYLSTIPPFEVSLLWMPAGVASLAVTLLGLPALPGVFVGALLVRVWGAGDELGGLVLATSLASTLQAWVVALLLGRALGLGALARQQRARPAPQAVAAPQGQLRAAVGLVGFVALGACTAATLGALALSASGVNAWGDFAYIWRSWWLGDVLGILILMPLSLHALQSWRGRPGLGDWLMPLGVTVAAFGPLGYLVHTAAEAGKPGVQAAPVAVDPLQQAISVSLVGIMGLLGLVLVVLSQRQQQHAAAQSAATEALRSSESRFRDFAQLASDWMWETDAEDRYSWMSESTAKQAAMWAPGQSFLGRRRAEVAAGRGFDVTREPWRSHLLATARRETFHDLLYRQRNESGELLWLRVRGRPREDAAGRFLGYRWTGTDVTAEKSSEERARSVDRRLRGLLESSLTTVYACLPGDEFTVTFMSDNVERMTGFPAAEFLADAGLWSARIHPEDAAAVQEAVRRLFADRRAVVEYRWRIRSGDYRWVRDELVLLVDDAGRSAEVVGAWSDITERKAAEASVRATEVELAAARDATSRAQTVLRTALESLADGFVLYDADDRLVLCNQRYREIYRESADLFVPGARFEDIVREGVRRGQYPEAAGREEAWLERRMKAHRSADSVIEQRLPNGHWLRIAERRTSDGGTVGFRVDITSLKEAQQKAEDASRAKSSFLAVTSHEIRTPLNGVLGALSLLDESSLEARQQELVRTARSSGEALLRIVSDVLDLSRIESGRFELDSVEFAVGPVVSGAVDVVRTAVAEKGLSIAMLLADAIPPRLEGDPGRLQQVLVNLLGNAVKFTERGGLQVRADVASRDAERVVLRFEVADTGVGVPESARSEIFEDFVTADASYARRHGGTGLGLAICRRIVEAAGGRIGLDSEVGRGSVFRFTFPLRIAGVRDAGRPGPATRTAPRVAVPAPSAPLRILLAEDVPANRLIARAMLEQVGHRVDEVASGTEAVDAVRSAPYDCVVMDIAMPGMDGVAAAAAIRALGGAAAVIPIVAVTAFATRDDRERIMAGHFAGYVTKPLDRGAFLAEVARCTARAAPVADPPVGGPSDSEDPTVDRDAYAALADQLGSEVAGAVVESYLGTLASATTAMSAAIAGVPDLAALRHEAHKIAGSSAQVGARRVASLASAIEAACRADDGGTAAARVSDVVGEAGETELALRRLIAEHDRSWLPRT